MENRTPLWSKPDPDSWSRVERCVYALVVTLCESESLVLSFSQRLIVAENIMVAYDNSLRALFEDSGLVH